MIITLFFYMANYDLIDAPFDEHLMGLRQVLRKWGADQEMEDAAALHSIYGTQGFAGFKLSVTQRSKVRAFIGPRAERLVCNDRTTITETMTTTTMTTSCCCCYNCYL
jgi:hypothetical protein